MQNQIKFLKKPLFVTFSLLLIPLLTLAQTNNSHLVNLLSKVKDWLNMIIPILIILAIIYFFWGVIQYVIISKGDEEGQTKARNQIVFGLIGIFVLLSIFGIINLIGTTLKINPGGSGGDVVPYLKVDK